MSNTNIKGKSSSLFSVKSYALSVLAGSAIGIMGAGGVCGYYEGKGTPLNHNLENMLLYLPVISGGVAGTVSAGYATATNHSSQTADYGNVCFVAGLGGLAGATSTGSLTLIGYFLGKGASYFF